MKQCPKCKIFKDISEYYKNKFNSCKYCHKLYVKEYKLKNRKRYNELNKTRLQNPINLEKHKLSNKKYKQKNINKVKEYNKSWKLNNKDKVNASARICDKKRRKFDINYKLRKNLRCRLYDSLKNNYKSGSAVRDLGCTIEELKVYLESKFTEGMNWNNQGEWHIDHIIPLASFDLSNREELLKACNYTNLQPLWAIDNLKKTNKLY